MRKAFNPRRFDTMASPTVKAALEGYRLITPHVEFHERMTLAVGERTFELYHLHAVHSESDAAIWLPKERVLFTAASVSVGRFNNLRSFVSIPKTLQAIKMMRALDPQIVIPGHGAPGGVKLLEDTERYFTLLMDRVRTLVEQGRTLQQIKAELKMPEYDSWVGKDRFPNNIEAAYRAVKGGGG
jgi:cyclase